MEKTLDEKSKFWSKLFHPPCFGRKATRAIPQCGECPEIDSCLDALVKAYRRDYEEHLSERMERIWKENYKRVLQEKAQKETCEGMITDEDG